jgi:hypothetical protein
MVVSALFVAVAFLACWVDGVARSKLASSSSLIPSPLPPAGTDPPCHALPLSPICTDAALLFPAPVGAANFRSVDPYNNYSCLDAAPDATFWYLKIGTSGDLFMYLNGTYDVDFIIWGPYSSLLDAQSYCGTWGQGGATGRVVDCSYSPLAYEYPKILGAQAGQIYVMFVMNFAQRAQDLSLTKTGGTATSDCRTVTDNTPPVISCPADMQIIGNSRCNYQAAAYDLVDGNLTATCTPQSGSIFPVGTTTVTCTATDGARNNASCSFNVVGTNACAAGSVSVNGVCQSCNDQTGTISAVVNIRSYSAPYPSANSTYQSGGYFPTLNRIYFGPCVTSSTWTYIDGNSGTAVNYQHQQTNVANYAYFGGAYCPGVDRLYFVPYGQSSQPSWHYVDNTGTVVSYAHGMTVSVHAYSDAALLAPLNRLYFAPYGQSGGAVWHYVDCNTGNIVPYQGVSLPVLAYYGAVYVPPLNRIYYVPYNQAPSATWHYIAGDGSLQQYPVPVPGVLSAYTGGTWSAALNRVYFAPSQQSAVANWHYIDCSTGGTVVTYAAIANGFYYYGAIYAPVLGRVYFIPRSATTPTTNLNYISNTGVFSSYPAGVTIPSDGYWSGVYSAKQQRIYFAPQAMQSSLNWQYLYVGCKCGTGYAEQPDGTCAV